MSQIKILPENLCNKIAAGEVVERPASVVKELIENSVDAGADEVLIDIESGGKKLIRVQDNGSGMSRDETFLSLERHATSKIETDQDLFRLTTLGFRGEALPSIAAVSRLILQSRNADSEEGWRIGMNGGTVAHAEAVGMPAGTSIEVRNLFYNTPARRKFLRRDQTETGHVGDVVSRQALARPEVRFRLTHNGRVLFDALKSDRMEERVAAILGREAIRDMLPVENQDDELALHGLVSRPLYNRSATSAIYTYINGRFIRDRVVQHAVMEGYRNLLMKGRYPVVVLFVDLPPEMVDVNVHPTKHEVRFRDQSRVHDFIAASVRRSLREDTPVAAGAHSDPSANETVINPEPAGTPEPTKTARSKQYLLKDFPSVGANERAELYHSSSTASPLPVQTENGKSTPFRMPDDDAGRSNDAMLVIGQFHDSYILCQDGDDLVLIDQHAAHERVGFERLKEQFYGEGIEKQALLFPAVLEFDFREASSLQQTTDKLETLGFELEPFGGNSFALKTVPRLLKDSEAEQLVRDVASDLSDLGETASVEDAFDHVLATMACHSVVRANQKMSREEMQNLVRLIDSVDFGSHCPHGRPVMQRFSRAEIERMFRRT